MLVKTAGLSGATQRLLVNGPDAIKSEATLGDAFFD
jgi:hypothetical protein